MSGNIKEQRKGKRKKPLSHGWIVVPSKTYRDRVYFYNVVTKCSTWINPCEVLDDETTSKSSSEASVESPKHRMSNPFLPKKRMSSENFASFTKENSEIEDYDEQHDQYFDSIPGSVFSLSHSNVSPMSSPDSAFSFKTDKSDSDTSKSNIIFENDKKELWFHFSSGPKKNTVKKSLALSDFEQPSTSGRVSVDSGKPSGSTHREANNEKNTKKGRRNKKKKQLSKEEIEKPKKEDRRNCDKIIKNISFKVKDKTPAQTGFLKFRRQYAEKIKNLIGNSAPFKSKLDKNKSGNMSDSSSTTESLDYKNYNDTSRGVGVKSIFQQDHEVSNNDSTEEMDWEPSSEESDVRNINEFRQQQDRGQKTSNSIFYELNGCPRNTLPSQTQELVLVLDTNIFVSCLGFVKELRDTKLGDLSYPIIYVPWRVLQELDHLKDSKIDGANKQLSLNVRKAISFLNENFKFKHPRVFGQSFEDFNKMMDLNNFAPDDEILQTCLELIKRHLNIKLMLLTNDKNLESKANVSGVQVFSKESFEKKFINSSPFRPTCSNSLTVSTPTQGQVLQPVLQVDSHVCEIKALLKEYLSVLVETEMRVAFEEDWTKIIHKKPPWTTKEALDCFIKHWRSVFFLVFSNATLSEAESLNEKLFIKEPANMEDVNEVISIFQRFIKSISASQKKKRPYLNLADSIMTKLSCLLKDSSLSDAPQVDGQISQTQFPLNSNTGESFNQVQSSTDDITPHDISKVKNLFRDIWESLRCFCCSMSDVMNSPNQSSNASLPELRLKIVQILNEIGELVVSIEKIFELNFLDINERHPLIIHFAQFLSNLYPAINVELQNKFPKCLSAFFTDLEGRSLLSRSLADFRDFSQELIKTSEFLKAHFA